MSFFSASMAIHAVTTIGPNAIDVPFEVIKHDVGHKIQSMMGHLRKDFEGKLSADILGAKCGEYGSFLPTHRRSPSIWSQPKSPPRIQNSNLSRSPNACPEGPTPKKVTPSTQRDDTSSLSVRALQTLKTSSHDASIRQRATLSYGKVTKTFPGKVEHPSSELGNPIDQRTLKVRIKVGPERVALYNAEINSLGLKSPSSSEGNSGNESDELPLETQDIPNESPAHMLQMMTSLPMSNELLLSPLYEDLLNFTREREDRIQSECKATPENSAISIKILNNDALRGREIKSVDRRWNSNKPKDNLEDFDSCQQKTLHDDNNTGCSMQTFHDLKSTSLPSRVENSDKNTLIIQKKGNKTREKGRVVSDDMQKDIPFQHTSGQSHGKYEQLESRSTSSLEKIEEHASKIPHKDVSVDHGQVGKIKGKGSYPSLKGYTEGEKVQKATDVSALKPGLLSTSSEHNESVPHPVGRLSIGSEKKLKVSQTSVKKALKSDSFRDGACAASKKNSSGRKGAHKLHLSLKGVAWTSLEHMENPKHLPERPSVDPPKNFNLDGVEAKPALADKLKERSNNKKYVNTLVSDNHMVEPPAVAAQFKEGTLSGLEQTVVAPVLINEEWVFCERCTKWRLLPIGTKSEQLPEKWICSMLDWLPGLNRCDVSEDETTSAVHMLNQGPIPAQHNFQAQANGTMAGAVTSSAQDFNLNHRKLQKRQSTVGTGYPIYSNSQMQMPQPSLENGGMKPSLARISSTNQINMEHPRNSTSGSVKLKKRKGEHVVGGDSNPREKIKQESGEQLHGKGKIKRTNSNNVPALDNDQDSCGNLGLGGDNVTLGSQSMTSVKIVKRKIAKNELIAEELGNNKINMKHDLAQNGSPDVKMCNAIEITAKKIKLKDHVNAQYQVETQLDNRSTLQERKAYVNDNNRDGDFHRDKKPRVSHNHDDELRRSQGGDISKRRSVELGAKEYPANRSFEKQQQVKKPRSKTCLTIADIDELRKDLGVAATSSSSKASDSCKNRLSYIEVKGSPGESVSSSPMRMLYPNQVSPMRMSETTGKADIRFNGAGAVSSVKERMNESSEFSTARRRTCGLTMDNGSKIVNSKNKPKNQTVDDNHHAPKHEVSSNMIHPLSNDLSLKSVKNSPSGGKNNIRKSKDSSKSGNLSIRRKCDTNDVESPQQNFKQDPPKSSIEQSSVQMEPWSGKVRIGLRQGDKHGAVRPSKQALGSLKRSSMDSRPHDASELGDTSKTQKGTSNVCIKDGNEDLIRYEAEQQLTLDASLRNKNVYRATASNALIEAEDVLKEAEELRTHADLFKNSGFTSESNYEYFKAALKFLHGASLLEACNAEPSKQMETSPMQMYDAAAQLCKICASEYEKGHESAFAALAYKCMEVAYLRVVYSKSSSASRFCQDLQSSVQLVPQGESPSSSASDVDNLNNLTMADKATLSKGSTSHATNHVIVPRNQPNFVRLLDFTKDVISAMEAAKKSQETFAAAHVELKKSQNKDVIISIKCVINFSFQDVEELIRLVWIAFNSIPSITKMRQGQQYASSSNVTSSGFVHVGAQDSRLE